MQAATDPATMLLLTQDPFAEKTVYNDGPVDKLFIRLFTQKMADQLEGEWTVQHSGQLARETATATAEVFVQPHTC